MSDQARLRARVRRPGPVTALATLPATAAEENTPTIDHAATASAVVPGAVRTALPSRLR